jgi:hypothetical protein
LTFAPSNLVKVVGGQEATAHSWPAIAFILVSYTTDLNVNGAVYRGYSIKFSCSGTLIDRNTVITAAHCVPKTFDVSVNDFTYTFNVTPNDYNPNVESMFTVYLGMHDNNRVSEEPTQAFYAQHVFPHYNFSRETLDNDIAMIKLTEYVTLNRAIQVACLPPANVRLYPPLGSVVPAFIVGWGDIYDNQTFPDLLQNAKLSILKEAECGRVYPDTPKNWNSQLCAGVSVVGGVDTCQGFIYTINACHKFCK